MVEDHIRYNFNYETPWIDKEIITSEQCMFIIDDVISCFKNLKDDIYKCVDKFLDIIKKNPLYFANIFPAKLSKRMNIQ